MPFLVTGGVGKSLALGLNNRGLTLTNRRLTFARATSYAQGKNRRANYDQEFPHNPPLLFLILLTLANTNAYTKQELVQKCHTNKPMPHVIRRATKVRSLLEAQRTLAGADAENVCPVNLTISSRV